MAARFVPSGFQWNGRVASALIPSLAVLMAYGGRAFAGVIVVGSMVVYILDTIGYREGAFTAVWGMMGIANLTMLLNGFAVAIDTPLLLSSLLVLLYGATLFLTGVWATLQFKWVQLQYPAVAVACEKLLVVGCMPVAAMVTVFGLVEAVGASQACWYLAAVLCVLYHLFGLPLRSSFYPAPKSEGGRAGVRLPREAQIQDAADSAVCSLLAAALPSAFYAAVHRTALLRWEHAFALMLLGSAPLLYLCVLPRGLWWMGQSGAAQRLQRVLGGAALMAGLAGFEGRVLFRAFGQYIPLQPPFSYLFVTVALYGCVALLAGYAWGLVGDVAVGGVPGLAFVFCTGLGGLAAGLPPWVLPAPLAGAVGLGMFLESRALRDYALFAGAAMVTASWFVWHHFWFLDIELAGLHLRTFCLLALAAAAPALLLPGLVATNSRSKAASALLVGQALLLAFLEEHLYAGEHDEGASEMYPAYMVLATSAAGASVARWLLDRGYIGRPAAWMLLCVHGSKVAMLVLPETRLLLPCLLVAMSSTLPLLLHSSQTAANIARPRLAQGQALLIVAAVLLSVAAARFAIFDIVHWASSGRPSEGVLLGVLVAAAAAGCAPLVAAFYSNSSSARRVLALGAGTGALLVLLRPPLPIKGGARCPTLPLALCPRLWDERHVPAHELDDIAVYGEGLSRREHWPLWLLLAAAGLGTLSAGGAGGEGRSPPALLRAVLALAGGGCVAAYMALEFFWDQRALQVLVGGGTMLLALFLVLLQHPLAKAPRYLPYLLAMWAASGPAALALQAWLPLPALARDAKALFPDGAYDVAAERRDANRAALLVVYATQALLAAFALKLKVAAANREGGPGLGAKAAPLGLSSRYGARGGGLASLAPAGLAGLRRTLMALEAGGWPPTAGNCCTSAAFAMSVYLAATMMEAGPAAIYLLAPMLLLLNYDPLLMYVVGDAQRYFPPAAAISAYLVGYSLASAMQLWVSGAGGSTAGSLLMLAKHLALTLATLPNQILFLLHLWRQHAPVAGSMPLLVCTPLSALVVGATDLAPLRLLGGTAAVYGVVQFFAERHSSRISNHLL